MFSCEYVKAPILKYIYKQLLLGLIITMGKC